MNPKPISDRPASGKGCGRFGLGAFGSIIFIAGCVALWFILIVPLMKWQNAKSWESTDCRIIKAEIESHRSDDGTSYGAKFTYTYKVDGVDYTCDENSLFEVNGSHKSAKRKLKKHPVGSTTTCFYDPEKPGDALLNRDLTWGMLFGLLPLIFILVGGGILGSAIFGWGWDKDGKRARRRVMIGGKQPGPVAHDMRMGLTTASNMGVQSSRTDSNEELAADEQDRIWDVPQKLKPEVTRFVSLLITIGVAIFWNGLVSIFVYAVIYEMEGIQRIFIGLFLVPFVLVGIVLIVACIHTFLAMFNPVVEVGLSTGAVPIGGEVDVAWQTTGLSNRIRKLKISIVGTQKATYRRGTDSVTDTEIFEKIVVAEETNSQDIQFGSKTIRIPDDVMHTFEAYRNEICWTVEVHGEIPLWPDVTETFPFRVKPA